MRYSFLILLLLIGFSGFSQADWGKVTVVGNTLGITSLTKSQVSSIFKGMKRGSLQDKCTIKAIS